MQQISNAEIAQIAKSFGVEFPKVKAVMLVEASGQGFDPATGKIKIQFEPHLFLPKRIVNGVEVQFKEWQAFEQAYKIDPDKAMKATSWGLGQILGKYYKECGYVSVLEMVNEFKLGEYYQVKGMLRFILSQPSLSKALKAGDWKTFARWYNGPDYQRNEYDLKLEKAYQTALKIKVS